MINDIQSIRLKILSILSDYQWHCGEELMQEAHTKDDRTRISELRRKGVIIESEVCGGKCGRTHVSNIYSRKLVSAPQELLDIAKGTGQIREIARPAEQRAVQPETPRRIENTASQPKLPWKQHPDFHRPIHTCCQIAIACYEKGLSIMHSAGCEKVKQPAHEGDRPSTSSNRISES